jgi:hypothetical protein
MKKLLFPVLCFFALAASARADIIPAPQITYNFKYLTAQPLEIAPAASEQLQCPDVLCQDPQPLGVYGIQRLSCDKQSCFALAYKFQPFQKIAVTFSDGKKRESQVFKTPKALRSAMRADVYNDRIEIAHLPQETPRDRNENGYIIVSFLITFLIELLAAAIFLTVSELAPRVLFSVAAVNLISIPFNWWYLANKIHNAGIAWALTFIFELLFIYLLNSKRIKFKEAAGLAMIINVASFSLGMAASYMYTHL